MAEIIINSSRADSLIQLLKGEGHSVTPFENTEELEKLLLSRKISLALLLLGSDTEKDINFNKTLGIHQIPFLYLTQKTLPEGSMLPATSYYCQGMLFGPFTKEKLISNVDLILKKQSETSNGIKTPVISEKQMFPILDSIENAVIAVSPDQKLVFINSAAERLINLSKKEIKGLNLTDHLKLIDAGTGSVISDYSKYISSKKENLNYHRATLFLNNQTSYIEFGAFKIQSNTGEDMLCIMIHDQTAEQMLFKELEDYKFAIDQHSIVAITDERGIIKKVNDKFCNISGYTREELIGKTHSLLRSDQHSQSFFKNLWDTINAGRVWKGEIVNKRKSGELYWVDTTIIPFMHENGKIYQHIAIRTEITGQKIIEEYLRENENRYRSIVEMTSDFVYYVDITKTGKYKMSWLTENFEKMTGYTDEEITKDDEWVWSKIIHPQDKAFMENHVHKILNGESNSVTFKIISKDGKIKWFRDHARPILDEKGNVKTILGAAKDISDIIMAEQAAERLLTFNESILQSAGEGILGIDIYGQIAFINPAAAQILQISEEKLVGFPIIDTIYHTKKDGKKRTAEEAPVLNAIRDRNTIHIEDDIFWDGSGRAIQVEYTSSPMFNQGEITGSVLVFKDISERLEAEKALQDARDAAEKANRSKSQFLANMSHELRTPLNSIIGFSKLMKLASSEQERDEFSDYIHSSGNHLLNLINDLLDFSKIEAGKMEFEKKSIDIKSIINESMAHVRILSEQKKQTMNYTDQTENKYRVMGDEKRLKQVIINLLSNALKFTPENGKIDIVSRISENKMFIDVTDSGIGIEKNDIQKIFLDFTQISSGLARSSEGTGLGLAIVKRIIENHNGSISVKSTPGKGSTFTISLPLYSEDIQKTMTVSELIFPRTPFLTSLKEKTVLIIEDNPVVISNIEYIFAVNHIKVTSFNDENAALASLISSPAGIIFASERNVSWETFSKKVKSIEANTVVVGIISNKNKAQTDRLRGKFDYYIDVPIQTSDVFALLSGLR